MPKPSGGTSPGWSVPTRKQSPTSCRRLFWRLPARRGIFRPHRGSLWVWLWTIARRQVALYYRKQKRNTVLNQAQDWWAGLDGEKSDWIDAGADMPPDILQSQELAVLVRLALSELPPDYQTCLLAKYVDNQPVVRIAGQMGCSEVTVRSKLARARKAFRKAFKKITSSTAEARERSI